MRILHPERVEDVHDQRLRERLEGGQGYVVAAIQHGATVSYVGVDALQGGVPRKSAVARFLQAVEAS